ncbi:MAG: hypothetical protein GY769_17375, partial [bacterium]|nr:hypothetical protein [bacterium]
MYRPDRPPLAYWTLPAFVSVLRALPYLKTLRTEPSAGSSVLQIGYNPPDWLAYLAMIRQVPDRGAFFFENPFTTELQSGRLVLLFHWLIGAISALTGADPNLVLELSRVLLLFAFFGVLWWFTRPILASRTERLWAAALIGLGGGLDVYLRPFAHALPEAPADLFRAATSSLYGWSTFGAFYNPLWIAALTGLLVLLRPVLSARELTKAQILLLGLGLALLWLIHPYSAIAFVAITSLHWTARALFYRSAFGLRDLASVGAVFALAVGPLILWQRMDPVFRMASNGVLGSLGRSVFWYPLTYGVVLVLAIWGLRIWASHGHTYRVAISSWIVAVAVLHSSMIWNGHHYVMYQHIPLSILAATAITTFTRGFGTTGLRRGAGVVAVLALVFGTPVLVSSEALREVEAREPVPTAALEMIEDLAQRPPGHVLASERLGNILPAHTHPQVF